MTDLSASTCRWCDLPIREQCDEDPECLGESTCQMHWVHTATDAPCCQGCFLFQTVAAPKETEQ